MIVRLPMTDHWTPEYQQRLNAEIEKAFERLNEYAQIPAGGQAGQQLTKASERDFDLTWGAK